ncbi:MAG: carboxylate-amine ligase [Parvularculaceae bacterium]|nr:carboxylate-amine ligase [Parvularculaceae bacterium]
MDFRFGVEEEYFLVRRAGGAACLEPPAEFWADLKREAPHASKELLQSQVEAKTTPCRSAEDCRRELTACRSAIDDTARRHGLGLIAAGTHPSMDWRDGKPSKGARYNKLVRDMRMLALRNMFCGLHVHVEIPDSASRVAVMNRLGPYLPLFLTLSVSSPLWRGHWTGMCGYRLTGYDELPRTGLPPYFAEQADYDRYVGALVRAGAMADESYLWWAVRPSLRFPTLELRICDSVTDVNAAVAIAALYRCLVRRLALDQRFGANPSSMLRAIAEENRWQIQCDGLDAVIVDVDTLEPIGARAAVRELAAKLESDARALGCLGELEAIEKILREGTSADRQIALFTEAIERGASEAEATQAVLDWLLRASIGQ